MAKSKKNNSKATHLSVNAEGETVLPVHEKWRHGWWVFPTLLVVLGIISVVGNWLGFFPIGSK